MDVVAGPVPDRQERRTRILGALLLGAVRVCCRLLAAPLVNPPRPVRQATAAAPAAANPVSPLRSANADRGPPLPVVPAV